MSANIQSTPPDTLAVVKDQLSVATAARKCHGCGCLHQTVEALATTDVGRGGLAPTLAEARRVFVPKEYDCLGCKVCYPALAANAFAEAFPAAADGLDLCPTDAPAERRGWPPLPGDYHVVRYRAPVAVCTLHSEHLAAHLAEAAPEGLAISGTLQTENLGIERIIRNVLGNPHIRFLLLCGEDTRQAIGHLPGQSLASLFENGLDERRRIRGARGKRPVLRNVRPEQVDAFVRQVEIISLIGETALSTVAERVERCAADDPGPFDGAPVDTQVETMRAAEPKRLILDPAGFLVVYPDAPRRLLVVEHYTNAGVLDCVLEGVAPASIYATAIERGLVSRLDHAAYLGMELARAEASLKTGDRYVQDRAPGQLLAAPEPPADGCGTSCRLGGQP